MFDMSSTSNNIPKSVVANVKVVYARDDNFDSHEYITVKAESEKEILSKAYDIAEQVAEEKGIEYDHIRAEITNIVHVFGRKTNGGNGSQQQQQQQSSSTNIAQEEYPNSE